MSKSVTAQPLAIITGASSGIGEATAYRLARGGYDLALCARRSERLEKVARECEKFGSTVHAQVCDVCVAAERESFIQATLQSFGKIDILFNNAGLALSLDSYLTSDPADVRTMLETNVLATMEFAKLVVPHMIRQQSGHLVFMGSVAAHQPYEGGSGYCASKHAQRAMVEVLRQELVAQPIRITSIDPGMVETEFSLVRFKGDAERAKQAYKGIAPLVAEDIADAVHWAISRPLHVDVSEIKIFPVHQADARKTHRS